MFAIITSKKLKFPIIFELPKEREKFYDFLEAIKKIQYNIEFVPSDGKGDLEELTKKLDEFDLLSHLSFKNWRKRELASELEPFRKIMKAFLGRKVTIPLVDLDGIDVDGEKYLFSKEINHPFWVSKITTNYPIGSGILKLYPFVSKEKEENKTGYNLIAKYSETPFLVLAGAGGYLEVNIDSKEFPPPRFIKVYFKNEDIEKRSIDVKIDIITFPLYKESEEE